MAAITAGSATCRATDISGFPSVLTAIRWMRNEGVGRRGEDSGNATPFACSPHPPEVLGAIVEGRSLVPSVAGPHQR
jgi:hypothetical protein